MKKTLKINCMANVQPCRIIFSHAHVCVCVRERAPASAPAHMWACVHDVRHVGHDV